MLFLLLSAGFGRRFCCRNSGVFSLPDFLELTGLFQLLQEFRLFPGGYLAEVPLEGVGQG